MKSIKFLAVLFAAILMTIPTFAQRGHKADRGHRGPGFMQILDLTDTQKKQAKAIGEVYRPKFEAIRKQETNRENMRAQMKQLRAEQETEFKKILTVEQIAKLEAHKAEREARKEAFRNKVKSVDKEGMKDDMKAYKDQNIKPILLEQRKKLEPQISAADQAEIRELRIAMRAAKKEIKAVKAKHKDADDTPQRGRKSGKPYPEIKAIKDKYAGKHDAALALVEKYDTQITALFSEIESKKTQWDSDMRDIKEDYFGEVMEEFGKHRKGKDGEKAGRKGKGDHQGRRGHYRGDKDKVAFLLMDVNKAEKKGNRKGKRAQGVEILPIDR